MEENLIKKENYRMTNPKVEVEKILSGIEAGPKSNLIPLVGLKNRLVKCGVYKTFDSAYGVMRFLEKEGVETIKIESSFYVDKELAQIAIEPLIERFLDRKNKVQNVCSKKSVDIKAKKESSQQEQFVQSLCQTALFFLKTKAKNNKTTIYTEAAKIINIMAEAHMEEVSASFGEN